MTIAVARFPASWQGIAGSSVGPLWCLAFAAAIACSLFVAVAVPLALTVYGLIVFGLLHNYFELRYVIGRYCLTWPKPVALLTTACLPFFVVRRLLVPGAEGAILEIALVYGLVIGTICLSFWRMHQKAVFSLAALLAAVVSMSNPEMHFVGLAHLHNVLPLVFLWWWAEVLPAGLWRVGFRALQVSWTLILPVVMLTGVATNAMPDWPMGTELAGDWLAVGRAYTPAFWTEVDTTARFLMVFAFMQTMHYVVWCGFFPAVGGAEAARVDRALDRARLPGGRQIAGLVVIGAIALGLLLLIDYWEGRSLYSALASVHAYLELPVILIVLAAGRQPSLKQAVEGERL